MLTATANTKRAAEPHRPTMGPESAEFSDRVKAEVLRKILKAGLLGTGIGAGTGLLTGLLGRRSIARPDADSPDIDLPYPQLKAGSYAGYYFGALPAASAAIHGAAGAIRADDPLAGATYGSAQGLGRGFGVGGGALLGGLEASRVMDHYLKKRGIVNDSVRTVAHALAQWAGAIPGGIAGGLAGGAVTDPLLRHVAGPPPWKEKKGDWADATIKHTMPTQADARSPGVFSSRWLRGDTHNSPVDVPWAMPAMALAAGGGLYGGHALSRWALKKRRKGELDEELEKAKREYEEAMMAQYDPAKIHKLAAVNPAERLDKAFETFAKRAGAVNEGLGMGTGAYLTLAALLAGGVGTASYGHFRSRAKSKMLADALKQRAMLRGLSTPSDVYIHPVSAHLRHRGDVDEVEEDEENDPTKTLPV